MKQTTIKSNSTKVNTFSKTITATLSQTNGLLASVNVALPFRTHYINVKTGEMGIEDLINSILENRNAVYPANIGATSFRSVAIGNSMFASDVISQVRKIFGADRYPDATIYQYLSVFMFKQNKIGKIKLSNIEDKNRPSNCFKPRIKFFIIQPVQN